MKKKKKFLNEDMVKNFYNIGGVRIEDDVLVTENGYRVLTSSIKEIVDIESLIQGN